jgi:hypothetical protein
MAVDEQKPAPAGVNPETLFAAVDTIDIPGRKMSVCDSDQIVHPLVWESALDNKMATLKPSYFKKFTVKKEGDITRIISIQWVEKPDIPAWVGQRYKKQGGGSPRNERMIVVECMLKAYIDLWQSTHAPDTVDFADARIEILDAIEADLPRVLKAGGV